MQSLQHALMLMLAIGVSMGMVGRSEAASDDVADYAFVQRPGVSLPLTAPLTEADGRRIRLGDLLGHHPIVVALGYFHCPSLCSPVRDDLFEALSHSGLRTPDDYELLVISIDPAETPGDAGVALADDKARYPTEGAAVGWHFLIGDAPTVAAIAAAVGFRSRYDDHLRQFLHPAGIVTVTPQGRVSGYVLGVGYAPGDLRAAVIMAAAGGIAKAATPLLLLCFHFDAATGRYSLAIMKVLRLAAVVTVLMIGGMLIVLRGRSRRDTQGTA